MPRCAREGWQPENLALVISRAYGLSCLIYPVRNIPFGLSLPGFPWVQVAQTHGKRALRFPPPRGGLRWGAHALRSSAFIPPILTPARGEGTYKTCGIEYAYTVPVKPSDLPAAASRPRARRHPRADRAPRP